METRHYNLYECSASQSSGTTLNLTYTFGHHTAHGGVLTMYVVSFTRFRDDLQLLRPLVDHPPANRRIDATYQAVSVWVRARTRTRAGAAHSVRSACVDLVPAVRAMCV